jgi:hypothetical protein
LIDGIADKAGIELEKHIGTAQAAVSQLAAQLCAGFDGGLEDLRGLEMRAALEKTDVHTVEFEHGNQV